MNPDYVSRSGSRAVVHVHQQRIRQGLPAIIVRRRGKSRHFTRVEIQGPSTVVHSQCADSCGARVVIETRGEILCYNDWTPEEHQEAV